MNKIRRFNESNESNNESLKLQAYKYIENKSWVNHL
jgi:hypothetical protein